MEIAAEQVALGAVWFLVFLFSTTLHEAAHAWAALRLGDRTAYEGGQVSLNPVPHVRREPFGMLLVPWLSFLFAGWMMGWASAPYDPLWADRHPRRAAWMALAGPLSNLLLVVLSGAAIRAGLAAGLFTPPERVSFTRLVAAAEPGPTEGLALFLGIAFALNLLLFAFNLLPLPPLDGAGVLPLFLPAAWVRSYRGVFGQPALALLGLVIAWRLFGAVVGPLFSLGLALLYPGVRYG